jgi:hypothetical protein
LIYIARSVVVALVEDIHSIVCPLVILIVVIVELVLNLFYGLFDWLLRLNRLSGLGLVRLRRGRGSLFGKAENRILGLSCEHHKANNH